jgi:putative oxidoreductase
MTSSRSKALGIAVLLLRLILGGIFVYAGYVKLRDPWQLFAASIASYELVPMWMGEIIAKWFPWLEIALGVGLVIGWRLLAPSAALTALVLLFFNVMLWRAFLQGKAIDCGCFGTGEALTWKTLVRDGSMLAGALVVVWWSLRSRRVVATAAPAVVDQGSPA